MKKSFKIKIKIGKITRAKPSKFTEDDILYDIYEGEDENED